MLSHELCQGVLDYTDIVITWDHIQLEDNRHLQENEETNGSITYLKTNTVEQLFRQDRPADQKHHALYFILGEQQYNLTVHDMRTALVNAGLKNHRSQATPGTPMSNFTSPSSSTSMRSPINWSTKIYYTSIYIFFYYLFQDDFKNAKMIKIQGVHQKIHRKQFLLFYLYCFLLATHLNLKRLDKRD